MKMYSTQNERKPVVAERFFKTLKNQIYEHITSISKNVYIDKLDDRVNEYNNTYNEIMKMKPIDVKGNTYINSIKDLNPKFQALDHVGITKTFFAKEYTPNWSEEVFVIKNAKNTVPRTYVINDLNGKEIFRIFYEKKLQKTNEQKIRIEKVKRKKKTNFMSDGKVMIVHLIVALIKIMLNEIPLYKKLSVLS